MKKTLYNYAVAAEGAASTHIDCYNACDAALSYAYRTWGSDGESHVVETSRWRGDYERPRQWRVRISGNEALIEEIRKKK